MMQFNPINNAAEPTNEGDVNPYNSKKNWDESTQNVERGLQGANDSLAYATPKKAPVAVSTPDGLQPLDGTTEETPEATPQAEPYQKTDYKKRYDDLKKHYDNKLNEWRSKEESMQADLMSKQPKFVAPKTPEELATFKEKYPDVFDVIETVAHSRAEEQIQDLSTKVNQLSKREQEIVKREAEQQLLNLHPDFKEIRENPAFHEWAKEQPEAIQDWIYNNDGNASLAARAIDLYKTDVGNVASINKETPSTTNSDPRGSAADVVSVSNISSGQPVEKGPKIWTQSEIAALSISEYERLQPELDKAFQEGRIAA